MVGSRLVSFRRDRRTRYDRLVTRCETLSLLKEAAMLLAFWSAFWPNLTAAIIAVTAGVPAGLWLNRQAERRLAVARERERLEAERLQIARDREMTRRALEQLEPVIRAHTGWFRILGAWGNLNEYHEGPLAEPWTIVRDRIVPRHLGDWRLPGDLAVHFERCVRLDHLVRLRSSMSLAGPPAQQERASVDGAAIKTRLNNMTKAEGADPDHLAARVATEIATLKRDGVKGQHSAS